MTVCHITYSGLVLWYPVTIHWYYVQKPGYSLTFLCLWSTEVMTRVNVIIGGIIGLGHRGPVKRSNLSSCLLCCLKRSVASSELSCLEAVWDSCFGSFLFACLGLFLHLLFVSCCRLLFLESFRRRHSRSCLDPSGSALIIRLHGRLPHRLNLMTHFTSKSKEFKIANYILNEQNQDFYYFPSKWLYSNVSGCLNLNLFYFYNFYCLQ